MTTAIIITSLNIALAALVVYLNYRALIKERAAKQFYDDAVVALDTATDAKETAKVLMKFINELQRCGDKDEYAETILKWIPILQKHGINIKTDL